MDDLKKFAEWMKHNGYVFAKESNDCESDQYLVEAGDYVINDFIKHSESEQIHEHEEDV